jgi:hypothetical protein
MTTQTLSAAYLLSIGYVRIKEYMYRKEVDMGNHILTFDVEGDLDDRWVAKAWHWDSDFEEYWHTDSIITFDDWCGGCEDKFENMY